MLVRLPQENESSAEILRMRTPRGNHNLKQVLGGFATITDGLDYAAQGVTGFNFYSSRGALSSVLTFADLRQQSLITARKLMSMGLQRGARVAVVAETGPEFMTVFFGCQYAGFIPCPVPYTMYIGGKDAYIERVASMLRAGRADAVITTEDLLGHITAGALAANVSRVYTHADLQALPESADALQGFGPDDVAYIQYSSGSTSAPKGVLISQRAIMANTTCILRDGLRITPKDRAFSWLPLYHDMGLVGFCLSPVMGQVTVDFLSTTGFARRPALWLRLMSENKTTITYSPTFGYDLAARRINSEAATLDLSGLRAAGIGGDMVRADVLMRFGDALHAAGFNKNAFLPSYGMAEATLAISFCDVADPIRVDTIERQAYKQDGKAVRAAAHADPEQVRSFVVCGKAMRDHYIVVRDETGRALQDRQIGRIFVSGPSLMIGYYDSEDEAIAADGFLDTGDMGYLLDGEIVITGRAKDLILHNGRNIWPQDIEWVAEQIEPLRSGDVAAFAVEGDDGDDEVVVLVQCRSTDSDTMEKLRRDVSAVVHKSVGADCLIVLVPPKSLPFTSSGKLSRASARQKFLSGEISAVAPQQSFLAAAQ